MSRPFSPMSKNLFKRAILQSGPAINPTWGRNTKEQALSFADKFKGILNCQNVEDELNCLQSKSMEEILESMFFFKYDNIPFASPLVWQPVPGGFRSML